MTARSYAPADTAWGHDAQTAIAILEACMGHSGGDTSDPIDAPDEDWRSDWDADRIADREENRRWRGLP